VAVSHDEHCGFTFPWSPVRLLPFGSSAAAHAWHHSHTDGMYASQFSWWDSALGTDVAFRKWEARQLLRKGGQQEEKKA
jgi:sterol desaturase/sphingolipid hydroxylase (fatty acid hydroxylase superfamily)